MPASPSAAARATLRDLLFPPPQLAGLLEGLPPGAAVLDADCGSGRALAALADRFAVQGCAPESGARTLAQARLGDGVAVHAATIEVQAPALAAPADAVLCLGGALCAVSDRDGLAARCQALAAAVRPGGWVIVEPGPGPESVFQGQALMQTHDGDGIKIVRSAVTRLRGERCQRDWFWLIARSGGGVETFEERAVRLVVEHGVLVAALAEAGLAGETSGPMWRLRRVT